MELTIKVNPTERTVRFREVHALAAGDAYSSVTLSGVTGAQTAALQLKLFKDSSASAVLAQCSSFAEVPGHPSERRGAMTLATQALKDWYESVANDATATDTNGMPSALVNAWLVISDSVKTWAACQVPLILRAMDTNVVQGADGISPTVTLSKSGGVLTISVTDVNGTHTETVSDGQDGPPGVSPTVVVDVNPATGNVRVTAVNADGSTTTREVDVSGKAEKSEMSVTAGADATKKTIQLKSGLSQEVLVAHQDVSGKAEKSEMSVTAGSDATRKVVQLKNGLSQTVLVEHQDVSGKMDGGKAYPAWSATSYTEGQIVWHAGKAWVALNDAVPVDVPGDGLTWLEYDGTLYAQIKAKQDALSQQQMAAVNSGATAAKVIAWDGYAAQIAAKASVSDVNAALDGKRDVTDLGVRGAPEGDGDWFTFDGSRLEWSGDMWSGGGAQIVDVGDGNYILSADGLSQTDVLFEIGADFTAFVEGHHIVGYVDTIAKVSEIPDVSGKADKSVPSAAGNLAALNAQGNLEDSSVKPSDFAAKADLPYAMVTPGEWEFSGLPNGVTAVMQYAGANSWEITLSNGDHQSNMGAGGENAMSVEFPASEWMEGIATYPVTATRPSLPGHLLDRAGNRVVVSGDTTLTLPAANPGYLRDFLVRLEISGSTVPTITFAAPTGETIVYETDGDEFPVPDEAGTWIYSFTENCAAHKFAVSLKQLQSVSQSTQTQGGS